MSQTMFPTSPINIPKKFTSLTLSYKFKAFLAILAILLFFALYVALVISFAYLVEFCWNFDMGKLSFYRILAKVGMVAGSVMLFVFTLKFIFKLSQGKIENRIKIDLNENTKLRDFIYKICEESGAPRPKNVYVDPNVNAYVMYSNLWLSLFFPTKKELTIGMGLINCINLSEFKAVIAHEFGHFSQSSMKIGSYINSANFIIHGMVYDHDKWDDMFDQWRQADFRLSAAAWIITPVIFIVRHLLALFYKLLDIMYANLSREMEFNADKYAVKAAGSDAIVSALWRMDFGNSIWEFTLLNAYNASLKEHYVENLYLHSSIAMTRNIHKVHDAEKKMKDHRLGGKHFFVKSEHSQVNMYASHPPNDLRENNAKSPYIECAIDEGSAWNLFENSEALQKEMTLLLYKLNSNIKPKEFISEENFEAFIKAESLGKELLEEYHNTFMYRFFTIPNIEEIKASSYSSKKSVEDEVLSQKDELKVLMKDVLELNELMEKAEKMSENLIPDKRIDYKEKTYKLKDLGELYQLLTDDREKVFSENFIDWDKKFCEFNYKLAKAQGREEELIDLYNQQRVLVEFYKELLNKVRTLSNKLSDLQEKEEVLAQEVDQYCDDLSLSLDELNKNIDRFDEIKFVALANIDTIDELKQSIVQKGQFKKERGNIFENGGFDRIMESLSNASGNCQRVEQKNIAQILLLHHELQEAKA